MSRPCCLLCSLPPWTENAKTLMVATGEVKTIGFYLCYRCDRTATSRAIDAALRKRLERRQRQEKKAG